MSSDDQKEPSMISGHLKYAQGAASSMLGYETGQETKESGLQEMRDAKAQSDGQPPAQSTVLGTAQSIAGSVTGCEGMQKEGMERKGGTSTNPAASIG